MSHFHLFTVPVVVLILSHLLIGTPLSARARIWLVVMTFAGALLDVLGPWGVRYVAPGLVYVLLAGWLLLVTGSSLIVLLTLLSMWGPERWLASLEPPPANEEDAL